MQKRYGECIISKNHYKSLIAITANISVLPKQSKESRAIIIRIFASVEEMAKDLGVTTNAIYSYIAELGLKKKKYHEAQKKVLEMYLAGEKISEISKTLDVSVAFIHKEIKAAGLKPRKEYVISESNLINENTVFADDSVKIEMLVINGKRYQDVTQIFGGR